MFGPGGNPKPLPIDNSGVAGGPVDDLDHALFGPGGNPKPLPIDNSGVAGGPVDDLDHVLFGSVPNDGGNPIGQDSLITKRNGPGGKYSLIPSSIFSSTASRIRLVIYCKLLF